MLSETFLILRRNERGMIKRMIKESIGSNVSLLSYFNPLTPKLNPSAQRCLMTFLRGTLLLEPCISLIYA
jgi:hypothetical protein